VDLQTKKYLIVNRKQIMHLRR